MPTFLPPPGVMLIDGVDVATDGVVVESWAGDLTPAVADAPTRPAGGGWGAIASGASAAAEPRTITVVATIVATAATLRAAVDAFLLRCVGAATGPAPTPVVLTLVPVGDTTGRRWTVRLAKATEVTRDVPTALTPAARLRLVFVADDPRTEAGALSTISLSTVLTQTPLGGLAVRPLLEIDGGAWTSRTVTVKDFNGVTLGALTLAKASGTAGVGDTIEVDCAAESIVQVSGSTRTPRNSWLSAGDFLTLDPADSFEGVPPGLVVDGGGGTASWRNRWR